MALTLDQLEIEAAKLSSAERIALIDRLHLIEIKTAADPEIEAEWDAEIKSRMEEIRNGTVEPLDLDEVMERLDKEFGLK